MKLITAAKPFGETPLIGVTLQNVEFRKPLFPGTEFYVEATVVEKNRSIRKGQGFVTMKIETKCTTNDDVIVLQTCTIWFPK